jgi:uncharacterized membrane protein YhaH (DUF805 family)
MIGSFSFYTGDRFTRDEYWWFYSCLMMIGSFSFYTGDRFTRDDDDNDDVMTNWC